MKFVILVSDRRKKLGPVATVHAPACSVVTRKQPQGFHVHPCEAENATAAAACFDEENDTVLRGLMPTTVCKCAL